MAVTITTSETARPRRAERPSPSPYSLPAPSSSSSPPRYSVHSFAALPAYPNAAELDISTNAAGPERRSSRHSRSRRAFDFGLATGGSVSSSARAAGAAQMPRTTARAVAAPWLSLRLLSNTSAAAQRPRYVGGEMVEGSVILNLEKSQTVSSIVVLLRGRVITSFLAEGSHVFLEHIHPVWKKDTGLTPPIQPRPEGDSGLSTSQNHAKGKFQGRFEWPFSFPFPTEFTMQKSSETHTHTTPQTLMERGVNATVIYEVVVKIVTGLFRNKYRIVVNVLYVPMLSAPPLPPLRADAYRLGMYLLNPLQDESSWSALALIRLRVSAAGADATSPENVPGINVACTVYIAKPTVYTRGTVIPCYMVSGIDSGPQDTDRLSASPDSPASNGDQEIALLEAFTDQQCVCISLQRRLIYSKDARKALFWFMGVNVVNERKMHSEEASDHTKEFGSALWWSPRGSNSGLFDAQHRSNETGIVEDRSTTSLLEGEIHLDNDLLPSCEIPFLLVYYNVAVSLLPCQDLIVERIHPPTPVEPTCPKRKRSRLSKSSSSPKPVAITGNHSSISSSSLNSNRDSASAKSNMPSEAEIASIPVKIVTAKGEGPLPVSFMPRSSPKKPDMSVVQDVEFVNLLRSY